MKHRLLGALETLSAEEKDNIDIIRVDIPLFIRLLEYAREDAKDDEDLHRMTERLTLACSDGRSVGMEVYDAVTKTIEPKSKKENL